MEQYNENGKLIREFYGSDNKYFEVYNSEAYKCIRLTDLLDVPISSLYYFILGSSDEEISPFDVPIISNFYDATIKMTNMLYAVGNEGVEYLQLGKYLRNVNGCNDMAYYKYGETHAKLSTLLGLTTITKEDSKYVVHLTNTGYYYYQNPEFREKLNIFLILRLKLIRHLIKKSTDCSIKLCDEISFLSQKTIYRRTSSIKLIINELVKCENFDFSFLLKKIEFRNVLEETNEF